MCKSKILEYSQHTWLHGNMNGYMVNESHCFVQWSRDIHAQGSRFQALGSRLTVHGSRLRARGLTHAYFKALLYNS